MAGPPAEPASFWASLANNASFSEDCRRTCVFELFLRHIRPGMSPTYVAKLLDHPTWLKERDVNDFVAWSGWVPIEDVAGQTKFAVHILPGQDRVRGTIYFRITGRHTRQELFKLLNDGLNPEAWAGATITTIVIVEDKPPD
jgi:hypothetical protein